VLRRKLWEDAMLQNDQTKLAVKESVALRLEAIVGRAAEESDATYMPNLDGLEDTLAKKAIPMTKIILHIYNHNAGMLSLY